MGGRGGSGGGGSGRSAGRSAGGGFEITQTDLGKMSDDELRKLDNLFQRSIDAADAKLERLVNRTSPGQSDAYYQAKKEQTQLKDSRREVVKEITKRASEKAKREPKEKKKFINSWGEATTREAYTQTYLRWQRRNEKYIMNVWMKGFR